MGCPDSTDCLLIGCTCSLCQNYILASVCGESPLPKIRFYAYISAGKRAKRIKTPDLHLSQRNLRKIQPPSSVLQASMPRSLWMVKMKMREKTTLSRPLRPVLSPSLSTLEHSRANQTSIQTRQIKLTISWRPFLTFFLKNEMKFFCMLLQPLKY